MPPKRPSTITSFFKTSFSSGEPASKKQAVGTSTPKPVSTSSSSGLGFAAKKFDKNKWIQTLTPHQRELLQYVTNIHILKTIQLD